MKFFGVAAKKLPTAEPGGGNQGSGVDLRQSNQESSGGCCGKWWRTSPSRHARQRHACVHLLNGCDADDAFVLLLTSQKLVARFTQQQQQCLSHLNQHRRSSSERCNADRAQQGDPVQAIHLILLKVLLRKVRLLRGGFRKVSWTVASDYSIWFWQPKRYLLLYYSV